MDNIPIIYEDEFLLVIDKPYGIVVNRASTVKDETLTDWVEDKYPIFQNRKEKHSDPDEDFWQRNGIVHRLDKETSGCLIIAKNPESFITLQEAFKKRQVSKTYQALVHGKIVSREGTINVPVGRLPWDREKFGVVLDGKESVTIYERIKFYRKNNQDFTLLQLFPKTGRTHQIRVHLKYLGFPIVGDYLYAGRKQQLSDRIWCPRVFLHASKISFPHPYRQKQLITAESPLSDDLIKILVELETS